MLFHVILMDELFCSLLFFVVFCCFFVMNCFLFFRKDVGGLQHPKGIDAAFGVETPRRRDANFRENFDRQNDYFGSGVERHN